MSIKARLLIAITALAALALVVSGIATVQLTRAQMVDRVDGVVMVSAAKGSHFWDRPKGGPGFDTKQATANLLIGPRGRIWLSDPSGFSSDPDPLPDLSDMSADDLAERAASGDIFTVGSVGGGDMRYRALVRLTPAGNYAVTAAPLNDVDGMIRTLRFIITCTNLVVLALLCTVVWFVIRRGLRPVDDMIDTAGFIAGGDLSRRVEYDNSSSEVGRLGHALNVMLGRIETSFAEKEASEGRLRQFVADASHELRTPLTSIRGYAELYRTGAASSPEAVDRAMGRIEAEGIRMSRLVEDLLLLARLDQGRPLRMEQVDLVRLTNDAVADAHVVDPDRLLTYEHPDEALVRGDADRLRQVVDNLITNARVHTDPTTPVEVRIAVQADDIVLTVADNGVGIAPEHAEQVFNRFFRVDTSRSRARGGTGLGLSIVAAIVEAHEGNVALDTAPGEGTIVRVVLPRLPRDRLEQPEPAVEPLQSVLHE